MSRTKVFKTPCSYPCCLLSLNNWCEAGCKADCLVDDILSKCWALRAICQGLHGQPQLVAHGPAVGVPPGGVPQPQEPVVQEGDGEAGLACKDHEDTEGEKEDLLEGHHPQDIP